MTDQSRHEDSEGIKAGVRLDGMGVRGRPGQTAGLKNFSERTRRQGSRGGGRSRHCLNKRPEGRTALGPISPFSLCPLLHLGWYFALPATSLVYYPAIQGSRAAVHRSPVTARAGISQDALMNENTPLVYRERTSSGAACHRRQAADSHCKTHSSRTGRSNTVYPATRYPAAYALHERGDVRRE